MTFTIKFVIRHDHHPWGNSLSEFWFWTLGVGTTLLFFLDEDFFLWTDEAEDEEEYFMWARSRTTTRSEFIRLSRRIYQIVRIYPTKRTWQTVRIYLTDRTGLPECSVWPDCTECPGLCQRVLSLFAEGGAKTGFIWWPGWMARWN